MIITRSPLRLSLGGGGTDLPSYYEKHTGFLLAAAIDKYVYLTIHRTFIQEMILKYSKLERITKIEEIQHPIIREALLLTGIRDLSLEITSMADIPAGTGLGSSGSFTTSLLKALHTLRQEVVSPHEIAEQACDIEINKLKEPIGKQDQFIAAYGGIRSFEFKPDGTVITAPLNISNETRYNLEDHLMLFFTGYSRSASTLLKHQDTQSRSKDQTMIDNLHYVKEIGFRSKVALESGDLTGFGKLMHEHWEHKKKRTEGMSNPKIDEWYELARRHGAIGGKLIGAGGGGFLLFYAEETMRLRHALKDSGLQEVRFRFDFEGARVVTAA